MYHFMNVGDTFGRLTVLALIPGTRAAMPRALARCECGTEKIVWRASLQQGRSRSCGCLQREEAARRCRTHGLSATKEYQAWSDAKRRTTDPMHTYWGDYGGRGIAMAPEWLDDFAAFYAHVGPKPDGLTLDRIDNERGYAPGNVRWADWHTQRTNQRPRRREAA